MSKAIQYAFRDPEPPAYHALHERLGRWDPMELGNRIKQLREAKGLTQPELAHRCGWGYNQARVSHYERGRRSPSIEDLEILANALEVSVAQLLGMEDVPKRRNKMSAQANVIAERYDSMSKPQQELVRKLVKELTAAR